MALFKRDRSMSKRRARSPQITNATWMRGVDTEVTNPRAETLLMCFF